MQNKWLSRKFWVVVVTGILAAWVELGGADLDPEMILGYMGIVMTWLGVQGWADKSEVGSGIALERQIFNAQMSAAMEALAEARGEAVGEFPPPSSV